MTNKIYYFVIFIILGLIKMQLSAIQKKEVLSNGIVLIYNYNKQQPVISTIIFIKMGSIYENYKIFGISSLLQSVITKGTKTKSAQQIAQEIEYLGGSLSADSDYDYSTLSLVVLNENFEKSFEILADIFLNPIFPNEEIEKERSYLIASILSRRENIFDIAIDEFSYNFYGKHHPYCSPKEGIIKNLKKFKRNDLISWWEKFYGIDSNKANIVISVSGDIEFEKVKNLIYKYFKNIRKIKLSNINNPTLNLKRKHIRKKMHFQQGYLLYGYRGFPLKKDLIKDFLSLKLLNLYLGGGMSGKLFEILREEKSLCYETNSFYPSRFLDSHFVIYLGLDYKRVDIAKEEIKKLITNVKENDFIDDKEFNDLKIKFKGRYLLDHQTNFRQAWYLGFWEIAGFGYEYDKEYIKDIESLEIKDIKNIIQKVFNENYVLIEIIPKKF